MKFYQHILCFCFALLRKSFTLSLHYVFTLNYITLHLHYIYIVLIKLKFITNLINTSVCVLVDKDMSLSKNEKLSFVTFRSMLLWTI